MKILRTLIFFMCIVALIAILTPYVPIPHLGAVANDGITPPVPGVANPLVTQANINQTICRKGWTATIRPTSSYTTALKKKQLTQWHYADQNTADFEEDHLISLELGGSPIDPGNLWPQSYLATPNARNKDRLENYLHAKVCSGTMTLWEAQHEIQIDWVRTYASMGVILGSTDTLDNDDL